MATDYSGVDQAQANFGNPLLAQMMRNYFNSIYGGESQQSLDVATGALGGGDPSGLGNKDYMESYLKNIIQGEDPAMAKLRQQGLADIKDQTDKNITTTQENLSATGLGRSGVGVSALNPLYNAQSRGISGLDANLASMETQRKDNALSKLLGLDVAQSGLNLDYLKTFMSGMQNANSLNADINSQPSAWGQTLGALIGAGGQIGSAFLMKPKSNTPVFDEATMMSFPGLAGGLP